MRVAYLDCFAGIAGDMFLGALVDAGVPQQVLLEAVAALQIGATLTFETVDRSGIACTKVHVLEGEHLAEEIQDTGSHSSSDSAPLEQQVSSQGPLTSQLKTQHLHKGGHHQESDRESVQQGQTHVQGRSLTEIRALIDAAPLQDAVKSTSIRAFELLGRSEAKIHNVSLDEIHFHEVGAIDAIVDIVASCAGVHHLAVGKWYSSALNVGGGVVRCAHGVFPVPAPATADLLRGVPTYSAHLQKELVTPTGAALLRALDPDFGPQPAMEVQHIGYGAGTRNPESFPNVLRLSIGEQASSTSAQSHPGDSETLTVLETALDDATPQLIAFVAEQVLAAGALDVMLTHVTMKKGRPGTLLTVLCSPEKSAALQALLLRETTTLGVRIRQETRFSLAREHRSVETPFGTIRIKVGLEGDALRNAYPEYEDCKAAALLHNIPLKQVQAAAQAAFLQLTANLA